MSRQLTKNQHYVPQVYLKEWHVEKEKSIILAHKKGSVGYQRRGIKKICSKEFYYDISNDIDNNGNNNQTAEQMLSKMEKDYETLKDKIKSDSLLNVQDYLNTLRFIISMFNRNKHVIEKNTDIQKDMQIKRMLYELNSFELTAEMINMFNTLIIYKNDNNKKFITSDNPVTFGLGMIIIPISPEIAIGLHNRRKGGDVTILESLNIENEARIEVTRNIIDVEGICYEFENLDYIVGNIPEAYVKKVNNAIICNKHDILISNNISDMESL